MKPMPSLAATLAALALAGCTETASQPAPPKAQPQPTPVRFTGRVIDRDGPCHTVRSFSTGRMYSVRAGGLGEIPNNAVVRLKGIFVGESDCPHPLIRLDDVQAQ